MASPSNTWMSTSACFRFLDLPGELRNAVYKLLTVDDDEIHISRRLPQVAQVCKQLRSEALVIYVGYNSFKIEHAPDTRDFLIHWLAAIGTETLRHLKLLSIKFIVNCVFFQEETLYDKKLRAWHELVACLSAFGLQPRQLRWTCPGGFAEDSDEPTYFYDATNSHLFARYILEPLLADHNLLSQDNHTIDVLEGLRRAQQSTTLDQTKRDFAGSAISEIEDVEEKRASQALYSDRLRHPYHEYVQQVLAQEKGMIGSSYDLKYLHNQISSSDYKQSNNFKQL